MYKNYWILIISLLLFGSAKSQNLDKVGRLENIISEYFDNSRDLLELEAIGKLNRPSEAFFVILDIDSLGNVITVHLFTEETKDSGYAIMKNLKPIKFKDWKEEEFKLRSVVIPVIVLGKDQERNYVYYLADMISERRAARKIVVGKTVILGWPTIIRHESIPSYPVK